MPGERLQKILARHGLGSRRSVEALIRDGRVRVDGAVAELGRRADPAASLVTVDGAPLPPLPPDRTLLLHKPRGVPRDRLGRARARDGVRPARRPAGQPAARRAARPRQRGAAAAHHQRRAGAPPDAPPLPRRQDLRGARRGRPGRLGAGPPARGRRAGRRPDRARGGGAAAPRWRWLLAARGAARGPQAPVAAHARRRRAPGAAADPSLRRRPRPRRARARRLEAARRRRGARAARAGRAAGRPGGGLHIIAGHASRGRLDGDWRRRGDGAGRDRSRTCPAAVPSAGRRRERVGGAQPRARRADRLGQERRRTRARRAARLRLSRHRHDVPRLHARRLRRGHRP